MSKRVVMVTYGSLGDLHPYLALGNSLVNAGCKVVFACSPRFRESVESAGLQFVAVPPDLRPYEQDTDFQAKGLHPRTGAEYIIRNLFLPFVKHSYNLLLNACQDADLIISHVLAFAVPLVAEKLNIPWIQVFLQPGSTFSVGDAPVLAAAPFLKRLPFQPNWMYRGIYSALDYATSSWFHSIKELRISLGLSAHFPHPVLSAGSPYGTIGLFSKYLVTPQPDWPAEFRVVGFTRPWPESETDLSPDAERFIKDEHPLVFSLGSTAVFQPGNFYDVSTKAASRLGRAAVLLGHTADRDGRGTFIAPSVLALRYAPYGQLFPFAEAVIHHGGIGGVHHVLRSGKPSLIVPFTYDQPDNAYRVTSLGCALTLPRLAYSEKRAYRSLHRLLSDSSFCTHAEAMRLRIRDEEDRNDFIRYVFRKLSPA